MVVLVVVVLVVIEMDRTLSVPICLNLVKESIRSKEFPFVVSTDYEIFIYVMQDLKLVICYVIL